MVQRPAGRNRQPGVRPVLAIGRRLHFPAQLPVVRQPRSSQLFQVGSLNVALFKMS